MNHSDNFEFWAALKTTTAITTFDLNFTIIGFLFILAISTIKGMNYIDKNVARRIGFKLAPRENIGISDLYYRVLSVSLICIAPPIVFIFIMAIYMYIKIRIYY